METDLKKHIDREEMDRLPLYTYQGEIIVIEDALNADEVADQLRRCKLLGFDTETRPAFRKGESYKVGLLQLATTEHVYLFRLNKCGLGRSLRQLLEDPQVFKIGVGIRDDLRNLKKLGEFKPAGFIDMQEYAARFGIEDKSFSKLMAIIFKVRISKRQRISNWEAQELTDAQIRYAATDAWGALRMYQQLTLEES